MGMTMRMRISVLGVDLGKNVCSLVGFDASGAVVLRRRAKRETLIALAAKLPPCVVAMEACCGRPIIWAACSLLTVTTCGCCRPSRSGPTARRRRPPLATPQGSLKRRRLRRCDLSSLKSQEQLDMQTLHRSRDRLVGERTALINQLRATLLERGIVAPQGKRKLEQIPRQPDGRTRRSRIELSDDQHHRHVMSNGLNTRSSDRCL